MADKIDIVIQRSARSPSLGDGQSKSTAEEQGATGSSQHLQSSDMREFFTEVMKQPQDETRNSSQEKGPKIPKVPSWLREQNEDCYLPTVVSIGPYHHNTTKLQEMKELKFNMAREFVLDSQKSIEVLCSKVAEVAKNARECYVEESVREFDDNKFTQMMFLDGCFILQFIMDCLYYKPEHMKMDRDKVVLVTRDLILLENQLPFDVLNVLLKEIDEFWFQDIRKPLIDQFLWSNIRGLPTPQHSWNQVIKNSWNLFCRYILRRPRTSFPSDEENSKAFHLIDQLGNLFARKQQSIPLPQGKQFLYGYRPAMELKRAGINFKPSRTNLFTDVKFKSTLFGGTLKLPKIIVNQSTKHLLLNLVANESCRKASDRSVTSYVCFMDSLIDSAEDVAELRSNGIIINFLPDDKAVSELFNKIAHNLVPNHDVYAKVKMDIESYYSSTMKKILVGWWKFYFDSPWYTFAYAGAILVVMLTFIQTYLAAFPPRGT